MGGAGGGGGGAQTCFTCKLALCFCSDFKLLLSMKVSDPINESS